MANSKTHTCPTCDGTGQVPFAFVAVVARDGSYQIGRADKNIAGYTPAPGLGTFFTYADASNEAKHLNTDAGIDLEDAAAIVASSMFKR